MKKICLLITMILSCVVTLQAFGQACTTDYNCGTTYHPYSPTGVYNENTTDSSNQYAVAYGRAMQAGYAQKAAEEAKRKEECKKAVADQYGASCSAQADDFHNKDVQHCNNLAVGGALVGAGGTVALGVLSILSGPPGWVVALTFIAGSAATVGGSVTGAYGTTSCLVTAESVFKDNTKICTDNVTKLQAKLCP